MARSPLRLGALAATLVAATCTGAPQGSPTAGPSGPRPTLGGPPPIPSLSGPPVGLDVVGSVNTSRITPGLQDDRSYVNGMKLAVEQINGQGGVRGRPVELRMHDDGGVPATATRIIEGLLDRESTGILYMGPGTALTPLQLRFVQAGTPVVLLGGDLYTSRQMFRQVFQTGIPWQWEVRAIARYLVVDREASTISLAAAVPERLATSVGDATRTAVEYWGGRFVGGVAGQDAAGVERGLDRPENQTGQAVVLYGAPHDVQELAGFIRTLPRPPRWVAGPETLLTSSAKLPFPSPGTTACSTYTWSGWAEPVPRVRAFADAHRAAGYSNPADLSQQGYDAVRILVRALRKTGGRGGPALTAAMEATGDVAFSGFPITLGPDDHVFPPRDELGLFVVPTPGEYLDPWQGEGGAVWRPIMRTYSYDGKRTAILDRDKRVFFPFWGPNQPSPPYWRSRYGIISREGDPRY
jgi:branched-chain amino acid transport system substrate-binding protein